MSRTLLGLVCVFLPAFTLAAEEDPHLLRNTPAVRWLQQARIAAPPESLKLDGFYKKYVAVFEIPIVSSAKVSDAALLEAGYLTYRMLEDRPDIARGLATNGTRIAVMAVDEYTTDLPEFARMQPKDYWDRRARGMGAIPHRRVTTCGEENLLQLAGDPYAAENIFIHEFGHSLHHMGLNFVDPQFDERLKRAYQAAMSSGLWKGKYAASNRAEYWAEGVQSFFGTNRPPDHDHNHVDSRRELFEYDRPLAELLDDVFRGADWVYVPPKHRTWQPHLKGLDRETLPRFAWPQRLQAESAKLNELKRKRRSEAEK